MKKKQTKNSWVINNEWWENAIVSSDSKYKIIRNFPNFSYGIWYDGTWRNGTWGGVCWLNGKWIFGEILSVYTIWDNCAISPKSHYKPIKTLSLNYAKYS